MVSEPLGVFFFCSSCFVASKSEFFQEKSKFLGPESILFKAVRNQDVCENVGTGSRKVCGPVLAKCTGYVLANSPELVLALGPDPIGCLAGSRKVCG